MSNIPGPEAAMNVVLIPGLYPNLPGVGERIREKNYSHVAETLQTSLGDLAAVSLFDPSYHGGRQPAETECELDEYLEQIAEQGQQPVRVAGASLGGNIAFDAALRNPDTVLSAVAVSAPLHAVKSPPPFLRVSDGSDMEFVERARKTLEAAEGEDALSRLTSIYGEHDIFVSPELSQWDGVKSLTVPGYMHPRIITRILGDSNLMTEAL